jgi:hypothetical protein
VEANTLDRKTLRIYGAVAEQGIRRIRTDEKFSELHKCLEIIAYSKKETEIDSPSSENG